MAFTTLGQLENAILKTFEPALDRESYSVEEIFRYYLDTFYDEFEPDWYIRKYKLMRTALHFTDVINEGNGSYFETWFDEHWDTGNWDDDTILYVNLQGSHGGVASGTHIWGSSIKEINATIFKNLKTFLRGAGLPVI